MVLFVLGVVRLFVLVVVLVLVLEYLLCNISTASTFLERARVRDCRHSTYRPRHRSRSRRLQCIEHSRHELPLFEDEHEHEQEHECE
jgi:hypothetical protein